MNDWMDEWLAVVCKRGHIATRITEAYRVAELGEYCADCGARLYHQCPSCDRQLPIIDVGADASPFCIACGLPYPWATRKQLVYHVQNQLERVDLDEGDRRALQEQLEELLNAPADNNAEKRQAKVLKKLGDMVPAFYRDVAVPVLTPILTALMKQEMGLPAQ